jgi:hypothetical protein
MHGTVEEVTNGRRRRRPDQRSYLQVTDEASLDTMIAGLVTFQPPATVTRHGGARERCPDCPDAGTIVTTTTCCARCKKTLASITKVVPPQDDEADDSPTKPSVRTDSQDASPKDVIRPSSPAPPYLHYQDANPKNSPLYQDASPKTVTANGVDTSTVAGCRMWLADQLKGTMQPSHVIHREAAKLNITDEVLTAAQTVLGVEVDIDPASGRRSLRLPPGPLQWRSVCVHCGGAAESGSRYCATHGGRRAS